MPRGLKSSITGPTDDAVASRKLGGGRLQAGVGREHLRRRRQIICLRLEAVSPTWGRHSVRLLKLADKNVCPTFSITLI